MSAVAITPTPSVVRSETALARLGMLVACEQPVRSLSRVRRRPAAAFFTLTAPARPPAAAAG
jgi:hypothetical protein